MSKVFSRLQEKHLQDILMRSGKSMEINKEADNMCTALEKLIEDGKKEGMQEGRLTSVKNLMGEYGMEGRAGDECIENLTRRQE